MVIVKLTKKSVYYCGKTRFLPGVNKVEEADLAKLKEHPSFMKKVELGWIVIQENKKLEDIKKSPAEMKALIKETLDVAELEDIIANDARVDVKKAAQKQLDYIHAQEVKPSDSSDKDNA